MCICTCVFVLRGIQRKDAIILIIFYPFHLHYKRDEDDLLVSSVSLKTAL